MTRTLAVVLSLVMCLPCACQKQEGKVARPEGYEQATDGPPSQAMYGPDANLLRDQAEVAREYGGRPAAGTTSRPTSAPAAGGAIEEVKQVLSALIGVAKADFTKIADFLTDQDAALMRPVLTAAKELGPKVEAFAKLVQDKLGIPLPQGLKGATSTQEMFKGTVAGLGDIPLDQLKYEQSGQTVVVTDPGGQTHSFVRSGGAWKLQLDPAARSLLGITGEVLSAMGKLLDAMTTGINDGSITKDNFDAKGEELAKQIMEPVMEKFAKAMGEMMKDAMKGLGGPGAPVTAPAEPAPIPMPPPGPAPTL